MKTTLYITCLTLFFATVSLIAMGQDDESVKKIYIRKADSAILDKVKLDFAVPDMPAFKALGKDPSNLLRPSSPKDIAFMFGNFRSNSNTVIPKNFAVEIAPGLFKPWYKLSDYRERPLIRFLTKARISAGSDVNEETGISSFSAGVHFTLLDNSDHRKDPNVLKKIYEYQDNYTNIWKKLRDEIIVKRGLTLAQYAGLTQKEQDEILREAKLAAEKMVGFDLDTEISNTVKEYRKENWNASKMDFAYASLFQSSDSLFNNARAVSHSFWFTYAIKPGKNNNWSQLILGINNKVVNADNRFYNEFNGNLRFYLGSNRVKGFLEGQYKNLDNPVLRQESVYSQVGVEIAAYKSIWLHFGTGIVSSLQTSKRTELLSNINLYFSFPENLQIF